MWNFIDARWRDAVSVWRRPLYEYENALRDANHLEAWQVKFGSGLTIQFDCTGNRPPPPGFPHWADWIDAKARRLRFQTRFLLGLWAVLLLGLAFTAASAQTPQINDCKYVELEFWEPSIKCNKIRSEYSLRAISALEQDVEEQIGEIRLALQAAENENNLQYRDIRAVALDNVEFMENQAEALRQLSSVVEALITDLEGYGVSLTTISARSSELENRVVVIDAILEKYGLDLE